MVIDVNRQDETGEIAGFGQGDDPPAPGEPVGRVNLPDEPDAVNGFASLSEDGPRAAFQMSVGQTREKVMYGLMAVVMMVLAMIVILQGVFEQKMPV